MKSTFGSNECQVVCINSSQDGLVEHQDNPWAAYVCYFQVFLFIFTYFERFYYVVHNLWLELLDKISKIKAIVLCTSLTEI